MKKIIVVFLLLILATHSSVSHGQLTHQDIVKEAFKLLKYQKPQMYFSTMADYVGDSEVGSGPWQTGKIVTGAYREDEEDVVYGHYGPFGWFRTLTHFWNPTEPPEETGDGGNYSGDDNQEWLYGGGNWENAFTKTKAFYYGEHYLIIEMNDPTIMAERWEYEDLADLWLTGVYTAMGYYNLSGEYIPYSPPQQRTLSVAERRKYCYEILGRVCHLLTDMGVPAHCHNDPHPPSIDPEQPQAENEADIYEEFMKNSDYWMSAMDAWNDGGLIFDVTTKNYPLRYLFYVMNQFSDYYPSGNVSWQPDVDGDKDYYSSYTHGGLTDNYAILTSIFNGLPDSPGQINEYDQRRNLYPFTIRMVASLLYLFANEVNDIPNIPVNQTSSGTLPDNEIWQDYFVLTGDVTVPNGKTLIVAPGATIKIPSGKKIIVQGTFIARDCENSSITFDRSGSSNWYGIKFEDSSDDSECILEHCVIKHCSYAVYCNHAAPTIRNCEISYSMVGLYGYYSNSLQPVQGSLFKYNSLYGALLSHPQSMILSDNDFKNSSARTRPFSP